jgi:predicted hydrocarbon binding protein
MEPNEDLDIPIYPRGGDLVLLINSLVDLIGEGSAGILYNFGKQLAERYHADTNIPKDLDPDAVFKNILSSMMFSDWFTKMEIARDDGLVVTLCNVFELDSDEDNCNFVRGFLAGLSSIIYQKTLMCKESRNPGGVCVFTLIERSPSKNH